MVVYVSCKQRTEKRADTVNAARILDEMQKDLMHEDGSCDFVYVYVTDEKVISVPQRRSIVVIGQEQQSAFYGGICVMPKLANELRSGNLPGV